MFEMCKMPLLHHQREGDKKKGLGFPWMKKKEMLRVRSEGRQRKQDSGQWFGGKKVGFSIQREPKGKRAGSF